MKQITIDWETYESELEAYDVRGEKRMIREVLEALKTNCFDPPSLACKYSQDLWKEIFILLGKIEKEPKDPLQF